MKRVRVAADRCDRRFGIMAELGLNVVRQAIGVNQVFDPMTGLKATEMKNWDGFIGLAEKHGIYLMPVGGYIGGNDWLSPDQDLWLANGFHNRALHDLFDFVTFHPYPAWECVPGGRGDPLDGGEPLRYWLRCCIGNARMDSYGKPVVVQEFGWYGGGTSRFLCDLPYRSEEEHADYTRALTDALNPHVNGFVNWPTFDMPASNDISNHGGIFTHDGKPKALGKIYADLVARLDGKRQVRDRATTPLTFSLLGLYTCRAYQDRMWDEFHAAIQAGQAPDVRFI